MYQDYPWKSTEENRIVVSSGEGIWVAVRLQPETNFTKHLSAPLEFCVICMHYQIRKKSCKLIA